MNNVHVTPAPNGGWQVVEATTGRVLATFRTQQEARNYATNVAKANSKEMFVHGKNGRIRERNTFGNDPHPPRG